MPLSFRPEQDDSRKPKRPTQKNLLFLRLWRRRIILAHNRLLIAGEHLGH